MLVFILFLAFRIHSIAVSDDKTYFYNHVDETLKDIALEDVKSEDLFDAVDGYKGKGYGLTTQEDLGNIP